MPDTFKPIKNPYIVGNPIKGDKLFFGREDDFTYIKTKFAGTEDGGLIVLCGARRSGKTSILFQIQDGRLGGRFAPVLIDMQSMAIKDDEDFLRKITELIVETCPEAADLTVPLDSQSGKDLQNPYADFEGFTANVMQLLRDKKLLLTFDEYELIETGIDSGVLSDRLLRMLAGMIEHRQLFVVFTGSDKLEERNKPYWDVFLSKALHRRISFLSRHDTKRLIEVPLAGTVIYDGGIPDRIADLTAGQPFYTQVVCQSVVDRLNEERKYTVGEDDLAAVLEDVIENPLPQMIFHWNALSPMEKLVMSIIAELHREGRDEADGDAIRAFVDNEQLGYSIETRPLNKTLENLFHGDLLEKTRDSDTYSYKMGLWLRWVARMHSVWQVVDEFEREEIMLAGSGLSKTAVPGWLRRRGMIIAAVSVAAVIVVAIVMGGALQSLFRGAGTATPGDGRQATSPANAADLSIITDPTDAAVWVNGVMVGKTPFDGSLPAGIVGIVLRKDGFKEMSDSVSLVARETRALEYALIESKGFVDVSTTPTGAAVTVDGHHIERNTPVTLELAVSGRPDISVDLEGYVARTFRSVQLFEDSTVVLSHAFVRRTAPLTVTSQPSNAVVLVDGQQRGRTPKLLEALLYGEHEVTIRLDGYEEWTNIIDVPQDDNRVDVVLERLQPGYVVFSIQPWADILVDGEVVQQNVQYYFMEHAPGAITIEFKHPHYGSETIPVNVEPGDTMRVMHIFK